VTACKTRRHRSICMIDSPEETNVIPICASNARLLDWRSLPEAQANLWLVVGLGGIRGTGISGTEASMARAFAAVSSRPDVGGSVRAYASRFECHLCRFRRCFRYRCPLRVRAPILYGISPSVSLGSTGIFDQGST